MRVLVIRFSSLGDCVLLAPMLAHLRAAGAEVTVVTKRQYIEVFMMATGVNRLVALEPSGGLGALWRIARDHRRGEYSVIDAHNNLRSRLLSAALGGAQSQFDKHYHDRLQLIVLKRPAKLPSVLDQYASLVEPLGFERAPAAPGGLTPPDSVVAKMSERIGPAAGTAIAVAPGSRWPTKRWAEDNFLELCERITGDRDGVVVLMGDAGDVGHCAKIADRLGRRSVNLCGSASLTETAAALSQCRALVGNDSGLMHLAEAMNVPVLAVFGPTVETFGYFPALEHSRVVERELACRPCSRNGARPCPKGTQECMTAINVEISKGVPKSVVISELENIIKYIKQVTLHRDKLQHLEELANWFEE